MKVYVAYFIYKGVLEGLEVHTDLVEANRRADEWRKSASPSEDEVDVLVERLRGPVVLTSADLPVVLTPGESVTILHTKVVPATVGINGTPLKELDLPQIYYKRLRRVGYETVEQLCEKTRNQVLVHRLIGVKCIEQIELALAERGKSLQEVPRRRSVAEI